MSTNDGGEPMGSAGPYSIERVENKLASIQERIALLQASLSECRSPEQRQYLQAELAFVKTRQMVCQKHKGMLMQNMEHYGKNNSVTRPTYGEYLISGAMKLFQRLTISASMETDSTGADQASPLLNESNEGAMHPRDSDPIVFEPTPTLRKRKPSIASASTF